ncbi:hypothetical protein QUB13_15270 [Microcoleus sp. B4-D4]
MFSIKDDRVSGAVKGDRSWIFWSTADEGRLTQMNADEKCDRTFKSIYNYAKF